LLAWLTGFTYNNSTNIGSNPTRAPLFAHRRKWWYFEGGDKFVWSPRCVPEKLGVNQNGVNQKWYFHNEKYLNKRKQTSQRALNQKWEGVNKWCNWQWTSQQKSVKEGLVIFRIIAMLFSVCIKEILNNPGNISNDILYRIHIEFAKKFKPNDGW
jgi:hypothetical protein